MRAGQTFEKMMNCERQCMDGCARGQRSRTAVIFGLSRSFAPPRPGRAHASFKIQDSRFKPEGRRSAPSLSWGTGINASRWYYIQNREKCRCNRLIFRRLQQKPRFFGAFIAFNGLIYRLLRKICPIIYRDYALDKQLVSVTFEA
jgi:hypothetical protein